MSRSRIPVIFRHSSSGSCKHISSGTFLAASPITSTLRTNARLRTSSFRNTSRVVEAACAERNSASRRISRNSSVAMGGIANRRQDQPGLPIVEGLVRDEVDTPPHQAFEQFVKREEIVIRAPLVVEFNIDVDITVAARFAAHERAKDADSPRSKRSEFSDMSLNDSERVPHCVPHRVRHHNVPFKLAPSEAYDRKSDVGRLDKTLDEANAKGWTVVSKKDDWKTIFPPVAK